MGLNKLVAQMTYTAILLGRTVYFNHLFAYHSSVKRMVKMYLNICVTSVMLSSNARAVVTTPGCGYL